MLNSTRMKSMSPMLNSRLLNRVKTLVYGREKFNYGYKNVLKYFACGMLCRSERNIRRNKKNRHHRLYDIGERKILRDLNVINIVSF
jgi:hypothetical protein